MKLSYESKGANMTKKGFLRMVVFLALLAGVSTGAFAQLTVSAGFALSTMTVEESIRNVDIKGGMGYGGNVYFDYLLPIKIPLSLGFEVGADWAYLVFDYSNGLDTDVVTAIPLLFRTAYHLDLFPKLDLYLVGKIGYALGIITDGSGDRLHIDDSVGGLAFGLDIGVAYYFASVFGVFIEGGFDDYMLQATFLDDANKPTINMPFYRFVTAGISFRW
jgi:hypothetical protein